MLQANLISFFHCYDVDRLDPALIRPGRMDQKIEFRLTSKDQLQGLFEQTHLPTKGELERAAKQQRPSTTEKAPLEDERNPVTAKSKEEIVELAFKFSEIVPADTFSAASIQGYLFSYQDNPVGAIDGVGGESDASSKNGNERTTSLTLAVLPSSQTGWLNRRKSTRLPRRLSRRSSRRLRSSSSRRRSVVPDLSPLP